MTDGDDNSNAGGCDYDCNEYEEQVGAVTYRNYFLGRFSLRKIRHVFPRTPSYHSFLYNSFQRPPNFSFLDKCNNTHTL